VEGAPVNSYRKQLAERLIALATLLDDAGKTESAKIVRQAAKDIEELDGRCDLLAYTCQYQRQSIQSLRHKLKENPIGER
jgi:hypothetical protein